LGRLERKSGTHAAQSAGPSFDNQKGFFDAGYRRNPRTTRID